MKTGPKASGTAFVATALLLNFLAACSSPSPTTTLASTFAPQPTVTLTPTSMQTVVEVPTPTPTPEPTSTQTPAPSPTPTATVSEPPTSTHTPTPEAAHTAQASSTPTFTPTAGGPPGCTVLPMGGFMAVWQHDPDLQMALGCPTSHHPDIAPTAWEVKTAFQPFERGVMIWSDHIGWFAQPVVYVLYAGGVYERFDDTFDAQVDPTSGGETPPDGLVEPILGFGKVWREGAGVRAALGWATASETPGGGRFQLFLSGEMVWIDQTDRTYVFTDIARVYDVSFFGN